MNITVDEKAKINPSKKATAASKARPISVHAFSFLGNIDVIASC
jgi:hypothetical protein